MTIWVLHEPLTLEEEKNIHERTHLTLPFDNLPDLSQIRSQQECQQLLKALYPYYPPESIALRADRIWSQFSNLQLDDTIAVPLIHTGKVALAKISGAYMYQVDGNKQDVHHLPVTWYPKIYLLQDFGRNRDVFASTTPLYTVNDGQAKRAIREKLPYRYNKFVKLKWIWAIIIALAAIRTTMHLLGKG